MFGRSNRGLGGNALKRKAGSSRFSLIPSRCRPSQIPSFPPPSSSTFVAPASSLLTVVSPPPSCPIERPTPLLLFPPEASLPSRPSSLLFSSPPSVVSGEETAHSLWAPLIEYFTGRGVTVG
ncbi:hypothetical protein NSK_008145 [Nannochloropsis salina CCMP1776]|uniref:Uncharacterized protein n=1 Tax=Nannochloropsis salina CCMP1776 TaxID=1027361 RepID=A0A4D9CPI2_9STRA|nr:hypothetical protein NSK_008145 [Nannochloropsis salina CCMP1776]|eukprot:TFJ80404.1 hypothetical protein NSK_008145 [Nannochloropsis salina CCMP1776]